MRAAPVTGRPESVRARRSPILVFWVYGLLLGGIVVLSMFRPGVALSALMCSFALEQWAQSQDMFFAEHAALTNYLSAIMVAFAVGVQLLRFRGATVISQYPLIGILVGVLFAYALASTWWSLYGEARAGWFKALPYWVAYTLLTPLVINRPRDLQDGLRATLVIGTVILVLLLTTSDWFQRGIVLHTFGFRGAEQGNPLAIGSMGAYVFLIAALMNFARFSFVWKLLRWGFVVLGLIVCTISQSRGQMLGGMAACIVALPISRRMTGFKGMMGVAFAGVLFLAAAIFSIINFGWEKRWDANEMQDAVQSGRINTAVVVLNRWADEPDRWLIGLGSSASWSSDLIGFYPHMVPMEVLAEEGILGFSIYATILLLGALSVMRIYRLVKPYDDARGLLAALTAIAIFEFLLTCKQGSFLGGAQLFGIMIAIVVFERAINRTLATAEDTEPVDLETDGIEPQVSV